MDLSLDSAANNLDHPISHQTYDFLLESNEKENVKIEMFQTGKFPADNDSDQVIQDDMSERSPSDFIGQSNASSSQYAVFEVKCNPDLSFKYKISRD